MKACLLMCLNCISNFLNSIFPLDKTVGYSDKAMTTVIICKGIIAMVGIIAAALLLWYLFKRVADGIKWCSEGCREKNIKEDDKINEKELRDYREKTLERERLAALRKEYQMKALNYIGEQAKNHIVEQTKDSNGEAKHEEARPSCDKDTYLTQVDEYIKAINDRIEELNANT